MVRSFGFVEHFSNFHEIIIKHASLVKEGGYLIITAPNFAGFLQRILHYYFDKENMEKHYLPSMNPFIWSKILLECDFQIKYAGYFGGFCFWKNEDHKGFKKILFYFVSRLIIKINKLIRFESRILSSYCGIVAQKKSK